jgi:hypothetical protein
VRQAGCNTSRNRSAAISRPGFLPTGTGAHGITPGRLGRYFYISNRGWHAVIGGRNGPGRISVLVPATRRIVANWAIPRGMLAMDAVTNGICALIFLGAMTRLCPRPAANTS